MINLRGSIVLPNSKIWQISQRYFRFYHSVLVEMKVINFIFCTVLPLGAFKVDQTRKFDDFLDFTIFSDLTKQCFDNLTKQTPPKHADQNKRIDSRRPYAHLASRIWRRCKTISWTLAMGAAVNMLFFLICFFFVYFFFHIFLFTWHPESEGDDSPGRWK